jgi:D-proline reductase (dithiol) PrdB
LATQRIRDYYQALGYGAPYRWAHYTEVPFQPLQKPLSRCRVALITTAAPYQPGKGDQGPGAPYNAAAKFYAVYSGDTAIDHDLRISHVAIDRAHTTAEDSNTWFAPHFHGAPTNRSHRTTIERDCPELLARCRADAVDSAVPRVSLSFAHRSLSALVHDSRRRRAPTPTQRKPHPGAPARLAARDARRLTTFQRFTT